MNRENLFWNIVDGKIPPPEAAKLLGWKFIDYNEKDRKIRIEFDASTSLTNVMGKIQGGMLSAMLDDCMGPSLYAGLETDQIAVTLESKTSYFHPASPGLIFGSGRTEYRGGDICFTSGKLRDKTGKVLATATATYRISRLSLRTEE